LQRVVFGQNPNQTYHVFRYTDALGLDRRVVMAAVLEDLAPELPLRQPALSGRPFIGVISVEGVELSYHAYPVSEDLVNVGSITELR
jgi:hypothetical protein